MSTRLLRALLRLLPEEFRAAYARDLEATVRAEQREAARGRAAGGGWFRTAWDILCRAPSIHVDILRRDARLALRTLTARPVALAAAIVTLTIAIGANVAMVAVMDAVLVSPLPYRD